MDDERVLEAEWISALNDAQLRLACFKAAVGRHQDEQTLSQELKEAEQIYNWIMGVTYEGSSEKLDATSEESSKCDVKH